MNNINNLTQDEINWIIRIEQVMERRHIDYQESDVGFLYRLFLDGWSPTEAVNIAFGGP